MDKVLGHPRQIAVLICGLAILLLGLVFHQTLMSMVSIWLNSSTYGHGLLIAPISLYLIWNNRHRLAALPIKASFWGFVWLLGAALLWLLGDMAQINLISHFALVAFIPGLVLAILGVTMARALIFPLGYLFFMAPFGDFAIAPLQDLTAHYTAILVRWTGIPIYHENWTLVIPGGTFLVAEACAGVRFLIACVALGALIAGTFLKRWWKRVVFMALAIAVPIIANVVRAYGIVLVAHYSNFEHAVGVDHLIYGFVFLSFVMLILILAAWWMRDVGPDALFAAPRADSETADLKSSGLSRPDLMPIGAAATLALLMALGVRFYSHHALQIAPVPFVQLYAPEGSAGPDGWALLGKAETGDWVGDFSAADAQETWVYAKDDTRFSVFMAFYGDQGPGKEIISYRNDLVGPQALDVVQVGVTRPDFMGPDLPPANLMRLSGPDGQRLVWYWFILPSDATANRSSVKLKGLWAKFRGARAPAMVLAISAPGLQLADEQGRLQDFLRSTGFDETLQKGGFAPWVARHEMITGKNADVRNSRHIR